MENPYPHKPDLPYLHAMRERLAAFLESTAEDRPREERHRNGEFFRIAGRQAFRLAALDAAKEAPPAAVRAGLVAGLVDVVHAYELGEEALPGDIRLDLGAALAAEDRDAVRFLAALPDRAWGFPAEDADRIPSWIARTEMNLVRNETREAEVALDVLAGLIQDHPIPRDEDEEEDAPDPKPGFEALHGLLEATLKRDGAGFGRRMAERQKARAVELAHYVGYEPLDLVDFEGLGLCRLIEGRGARVEVASVYLPPALLPPRR